MWEYPNEVIGNINILYPLAILFDWCVDIHRLYHVVENSRSKFL